MFKLSLYDDPAGAVTPCHSAPKPPAVGRLGAAAGWQGRCEAYELVITTRGTPAAGGSILARFLTVGPREAYTRDMSSDLSSDKVEFIDEQVANGDFPDRRHALDAAMELLQQQVSVLARVDRGRQQLDRVEFNEYDEDSLSRRFEELELRVAKA